MKTLALVLLAALRMCGAPAYADPPAGLTLDPEISAWFRGLDNPATGLSCCNTADGHILADRDWRIVGDEYQVRIEGAFVPVPAESVLRQVPNPTGGAVAFWLPGTTRIMCFVRVTES